MRLKTKRGIGIIFFRADNYTDVIAKKSGCQSSTGPGILAFVSYCSANFQPILDCFVRNFK